MSSRSGRDGPGNATPASWTAFSPTILNRLGNRDALRRLEELAAESRADPKKSWNFDQIYARVAPPAPEWLAWVLAHAVERGLAEATVWVDCPCHGTPVRSFSLQDKIPARLACDFGGPQFEVEPEHRRLVFRFPAPGEAKELPPGGTSAGGLLRRILKTRFERIAEGASALRAATRRGRRDPGPGSPAGRSDAELTAETRATGLGAKIAVAAAADTDPPLGKIGRRSGRQRRVALLLLLLLVITLLVLRAWAPGLSGFETTVVRVLVVLSTVVVAYCLPEGFFNLVLKLLQKLFLAVLTAILMPFVLKALAPYLGLPLP